MRRGFVIGAVAGAALSLAVGVFAAVLPSTPTWALWRIKSAVDRNDVQELSAMVDIASVTERAVNELDGAKGGLDLGQLAQVYMSGGHVLTVFNDPDKPLHLSNRDVFEAWWGMRREGDLAYMTVPTGDRSVDLILGNQPNRGWRIVGITPISALIRLKPRAARKPTSARVTAAPTGIDAAGGGR
ncbi:MAG: DUF2939 domain-containing protein [Acidobacteriota bacterium]